MLKKIAAITGITAGLMMAAAPAFATDGHDLGLGDDHNGQIGLGNVSEVDFLNNVSGALGLCGNDVAGLGVTIPILSPDEQGNCAASGVADEGVHD